MKKWGLGAAAFGVIAVAGYVTLSSLANSEAKARVEQAAGEIRKHVKTFDYAAVDVAPMSRTVEIRDVHLDDGLGQSFSIGSIHFDQFDWTASDLPRYGRVRLSGVRISLDAAASPALKGYGYDHLEAQAEFGYAIDDSAHTMELFLNLEATDAGRITYRAKFGGVDAATILQALKNRDNPMLMSLGLFGASLIEASASYEDRSLFDRALNAEALQRRKAPDQVRGELLQTVAQQRQSLSDPQTQQALDAVKGFIEKPGTLRVRLSPQPPVTYAEAVASLFASQDMLAKRLNIRVERE
jgi:hypothetical protein